MCLFLKSRHEIQAETSSKMGFQVISYLQNGVEITNRKVKKRVLRETGTSGFVTSTRYLGDNNNRDIAI